MVLVVSMSSFCAVDRMSLYKGFGVFYDDPLKHFHCRLIYSNTSYDQRVMYVCSDKAAGRAFLRRRYLNAYPASTLLSPNTSATLVPRHPIRPLQIPLLSLSLSLNCASILGSRNKRLIRPARPIAFIFFSLYHFVLRPPLFFLSPLTSVSFIFFCFVFWSSFLALSSPSVLPRLSSDGTQMSSCSAEDQCTSSPPRSPPNVEAWAALPSDKPYNVRQTQGISPLIGVKDTGLGPNNRLGRKCFL